MSHGPMDLHPSLDVPAIISGQPKAHDVLLEPENRRRGSWQVESVGGSADQGSNADGS